MKQQFNFAFVALSFLLLIQILRAEVTAKLSLQSHRVATGALNRPVLTTGRSDRCLHTCNGKSFDFTSCSGILKIDCKKTYTLHGGWKLEAKVESQCDGSYTNKTEPAEDDMQTRVLCDGTFTTKFNVTSSLRDGTGAKIQFDYKCGTAFSSVTNKDLESHEGLGLNFYQNTFCNGTEISDLVLIAPGDDSVFTQILSMGGGFLKIDVGSCAIASRLLTSIDTFGVLYSYMIIPQCDPNSGVSKDFSQSILPVSINCNGVLQNATDSCSGLLLAFSELEHGTASCKCRGEYIVDDNNTEFNCTGETYGEQMRRAGKMTLVRSNVCVGKCSYYPVHGMKSDNLFFEGARIVCYGAAVKSTIFGPPPFANNNYGVFTDSVSI